MPKITKIKTPIKSNSGVGRPKFNLPKVRTRFNKKGYLTKAVNAFTRRIGVR